MFVDTSSHSSDLGHTFDDATGREKSQTDEIDTTARNRETKLANSSHKSGEVRPARLGLDEYLKALVVVTVLLTLVYTVVQGNHELVPPLLRFLSSIL